VKTGMT